VDGGVPRFLFDHGVDNVVPSGETVAVCSSITDSGVVDNPETGFGVDVDLVFVKVLDAGWVE
jgi:hypothetical protein